MGFVEYGLATLLQSDAARDGICLLSAQYPGIANALAGGALAGAAVGGRAAHLLPGVLAHRAGHERAREGAECVAHRQGHPLFRAYPGTTLLLVKSQTFHLF